MRLDFPGVGPDDRVIAINPVDAVGSYICLVVGDLDAPTWIIDAGVASSSLFVLVKLEVCLDPRYSLDPYSLHVRLCHLKGLVDSLLQRNFQLEPS